MADMSKRERMLRDEVADGVGAGRHRNALKRLTDKARRAERRCRVEEELREDSSEHEAP